MTDNYTCRGITKEGTFAYGYYCKISGADCLIKQDAKREVFTECMGLPQDDWVIITSPPQKCLGIRDCEGELIFEGDDVEWWFDRNGVVSSQNGVQKGRVVYCDDDKLWGIRNGLYVNTFADLIAIDDIKANRMDNWKHKYKIIHPTNKDEIRSKP